MLKKKSSNLQQAATKVSGYSLFCVVMVNWTRNSECKLQQGQSKTFEEQRDEISRK